LGFGGDKSNAYSPQFEGSAGYLLTRHLVVGGEYRTKPDNLGFAKENDWWDLFAAYAINKHLSVTAAYTNLGDIATFRNQNGLFASIQAGF
jgi:outer membrane receptor protein involved in Fe transport